VKDGVVDKPDLLTQTLSSTQTWRRGLSDPPPRRAGEQPLLLLPLVHVLVEEDVAAFLLPLLHVRVEERVGVRRSA
jgi:hypothetical protein